MKIRNGFVSNSSSSSFLIYGVMVENLRELHEKEKGPKSDDDYDSYEYAEELAQKHGLAYVCGFDGDYHYFGRSWDSIKDDETGKAFKEDVEKKVKNIVDTKPSTIQEAWYDG